MRTIEFSRERNIRNGLTLLTSFFSLRSAGSDRWIPHAENLLQYRNTSKASGRWSELELNGKPTDWLHTGGNLAIQRTRGERN
jgi:hypothetical protein